MKTKVDELYDNPKSKGFVNHLIKSYLPVYKIQKVWEFAKGQKHACNVCGQKLLSIGEAFQNMKQNEDAMMKDFAQNLKDDVNNIPVKNEDRAFLKHVAQGKILAFTGEKTDTCLCLQCTRDVLELTQNRLLMGDNNINYQLNQMKRDHVFNHFTENPALNEEEKTKVKEIKKQVDKKKTATLGDLQVLQDLKAKMEASQSK